MKKELEYAELDYSHNVPVPPRPKNAGLYTGDVLFDKKPWGNSYKMPPAEPDAAVYASHFYASHHIPSYNRPGNNHINTDKYKKYTSANGNGNGNANYNFSCHTTDII